MNDLDETTFARFAERFARIERQVPEPPSHAVARVVGGRRSRRLSPIAALVGVGILLAAVVGLAVIGSQPAPSPSPAAISSPSHSADPSSTLAPSPWTPAGPTILRGRVLDADGLPVPGGAVYAYPRPERGVIAGSAVTDADGRWALTLPSGNTYCLELGLSIPGPGGTAATDWQAYYGPSGIGQPADSWPCIDQGGDIVLDATLPPMRLVSGIVVDEAGQPVTMTAAGGPVTRIELTVSSMSAGSRSEAGADGRFSIWVPRGTWSVIAWVFIDAQAALSATTPLEVGADPVPSVTLRVDTSHLPVE